MSSDSLSNDSALASSASSELAAEPRASKLLYSEDNYVVLEPGAEEQLLTAAEMAAKLIYWIETYPEALPLDVQEEDGLEAKVQLLLDESCSLEIDQGKTVQWFAIRLEK